MAQTAGLIQKLSVIPLSNTSLACFWVGPHPTSTELFFILRPGSDSASFGAFKNSMVDALTAAYVTRQEVTLSHGDGSAEIDSLRLEPS
jgi:hypothetical protein